MKTLKVVLEEIMGHYYCEDPWYSCPLAPEGTARDDVTECDCGLEERVNKLLDAVASYNAQCVGEPEVCDLPETADNVDQYRKTAIRNNKRSEIAEKQQRLLGRSK